MNRDQWNLKMQREAELLRRATIGGDELAGWVVFDRRAPSSDRRGTMPDRRRASVNRRESAGAVSFMMPPVERYGRCCEWGLSVKVQSR